MNRLLKIIFKIPPKVGEVYCNVGDDANNHINPPKEFKVILIDKGYVQYEYSEYKITSSESIRDFHAIYKLMTNRP